MDYRMPGMDGETASRIIREAGWQRPIVGLSADATPETRIACLSAGMNAFLSKPISQAELRDVLNRARHDWTPVTKPAHAEVS